MFALRFQNRTMVGQLFDVVGGIKFRQRAIRQW